MGCRRHFRIILLLLCLGFACWFGWPRQASLRSFDPKRMAAVETRSWRHYYEQRWLALGGDLFRGASAEYGFSPWDSCRLAFHAAKAAKLFQASRSRTEAEQAIPALERYFAVIQAATHRPFDTKRAAVLELEWWQLRREKKTWQEYGLAVAAATAELHGLPPAALEAASLKRAEMMDFRDRRGKAITDADWRQIESGLAEAWTLSLAVVRR